MKGTAVSFGVALAMGVATALLVPPHWRAPGYPYVFGYAKNVEHAAVAVALVAAAASVWLWDARLGRRFLGLVAASGFTLVALYAVPSGLMTAAPQVIMALLLFGALRLSASSGDSSAPLPPERHLPWPWVAPALAALVAAAFALAVRPLDIDVYHNGEVLASAVDLLRGGRPYETFLWPHGLQDTGLTALWIAVTGKVGTSPVALAQATCVALGVVSGFALALSLSGSRTIALATSAGLVLALVIRGNAGGWEALYYLGVLVFVSLGFAVLLVPKAELGAGALFGLAYLFRLETGVYAAVAALAVLTCRDLLGEGLPGKRAFGRFASSALRLLAGALATLLVFRLTLGWPGRAWFSYTLLELPRYHRDAMGVPFPWPFDWTGLGVRWSSLGVGLGALARALLFVIEAARRRSSKAPWFLAVFAALATQSTLDRSDYGHLLQWQAWSVLAAILFTLAGFRVRWGWSALRMSVVVVVVLAGLDLSRFTVRWPSRDELGWTAPDRSPPWTMLVEHLRPNPPQGECRDDTFTPTEAAQPSNRQFIEATCEVEGLLRERHVTKLAIAHSAPWYYVRFGLPLPTRYFAFARAYAPAQQRELVADLRAHRPQALLQVRGFGALEQFDVPDALRVPVVDAYLRERRRGVLPRVTPIGDLYFWNEAPVNGEAPPSVARATASGVGIGVEWSFYAPSSGIFFASGWAADVSRPHPLRSLAPDADPDQIREELTSLEYARLRPDRAAECSSEGAPACGFEYSALITPEAMAAIRARGFIGLTAVTTEGATTPIEMSLAGLRILGELSGPEWRKLTEAVKEAAAAGAADRRDREADSSNRGHSTETLSLPPR